MVEPIHQETWRDFPGSDGAYEVSDLGRVRSHKYRTARILKAQQLPNGYLYVQPRIAGVTVNSTVHGMVARTFLGPRPDGMEVCHGNNDKTDNRLANLRYDTPQANNADKWLHGTANIGERNPRTKLTPDAVRVIRRRYAAGGCTARELAADFGVTESNVFFILWRHTWRWLKD